MTDLDPDSVREAMHDAIEQADAALLITVGDDVSAADPDAAGTENQFAESGEAGDQLRNAFKSVLADRYPVAAALLAGDDDE